MKVAIAYRVPIGPIQASLILAGKAKGMDLLEMPKRGDWSPPAGKQWDDYDVVIHFHNRPPMFKTSATVLWWMCDLRDPSIIANVGCTADAIFVCSYLFVEDYIRRFGAKTYYLPQCGNDIDMVPGRIFSHDCIFLGITRGSEAFERSNPLELTALRKQIIASKFHGNRLPVIEEIQKEFSVKILSREGLTIDQKWLYKEAPISLSISLPAPGYTSNRLYNILSSGGFALVNWFPGIEELFENGKHLVWFTSPKEARDLVRFYLECPKERDKIRQAGHRLYLENHTASARIESMLEKM